MSVDHVTEALDRLPDQVRNDPNVIALLTALVRPFQTLETAQQQLLLERSVDTAIGTQLDTIGRLVGQAREGLDDDTYRRYIRARIRTSRSRGIVEDLITIARLVVDDVVASVVVDQQGIATVVLRIEDVTVSETVAEAAITFLRVAVSAGVRLIFEHSEGTPAATFALDADVAPTVGLGFETPYRILLIDHTVSGFTTVLAVRPDIDPVDAFALTFETIPDPGGAGAGVLDDTGPAITFTYRSSAPNTTIAQLEAALQTSAWFHVAAFSTVSGSMIDPDDTFGPIPTYDEPPIAGGVLAGALE